MAMLVMIKNIEDFFFFRNCLELQNEIGQNERPFHQKKDEALIEGRNISVCVRVRPLMNLESDAGFFESVFADHPSVHTLEPKLDVRGNPKTVPTKFDADFVFGPEHTNDEVRFFSWERKIWTKLNTQHNDPKN
jgi:hypothetical protein